MLKRNVSEKEAVVRFVVAVILLLAGHWLLSIKMGWGAALNILGIIALITGYFRYCLLYEVIKRGK